MATTITQPAAVLQPWKVLRQAVILAVVMAVGIGAGFLLDGNSREAVRVDSEAVASQRLQELADSLVVTPQAGPIDTRGATYDPAAGGIVYGVEPVTTPAQRLQELADSLVVTPQAGPIDTRGATYDPAFGGIVYGAFPVEELNWTPLEYRHPEVVVAEHGDFTPMEYRHPSVITERFGGLDANLDPDVVPVDPRGIPEAS